MDLDGEKNSFGRNKILSGDLQLQSTNSKPAFTFKINLSSRREKRRLDESPVREDVTSDSGSATGMSKSGDGTARETQFEGTSDIMSDIQSLDSNVDSEPDCVQPIQWASKHKPITTKLISSVARRVQSGNWNVPVLRNCVKREEIQENTVRKIHNLS